jgi:hypothetical protein
VRRFPDSSTEEHKTFKKPPVLKFRRLLVCLLLFISNGRRISCLSERFLATQIIGAKAHLQFLRGKSSRAPQKARENLKMTASPSMTSTQLVRILVRTWRHAGGNNRQTQEKTKLLMLQSFSVERRAPAAFSRF